jgi:hypothetical protein
MSILFNGENYSLRTDNNGNNILLSQYNASYSCFIRYDGDPMALATAIRVCTFTNGGRMSISWASWTPTQVLLRAQLTGPSGFLNGDVVAFPGTVYHIAGVWSSGRQILYANGAVTASGSIPGTTSGGAAGYFGLWGSPTGCPWQVSDFAMWNNYSLTQADVAALRDGAAPSSIGVGSPLRVEYSLEGPINQPLNMADSGFKNWIGPTGYNFTTTNGSPTGVNYYTPKLVFSPSVSGIGTVLTCGSLVRYEFSVIGAGSTVNSPTITATPTITINGTGLGSLIPLTAGSTWTDFLYRIPSGVIVSPGDDVRYDAPLGWVQSSAGLSEAAVSQGIANRAGRSAYYTDELTKTLRPGMNFPWTPIESTAYCITKNLMFRCRGFANTVFNRDGTVTMPNTTDTAPIINDGTPSNISPREYLPIYPDGYYAVGWDDYDPINNPTTFDLIPKVFSTQVSVTEVTGSRNFGTPSGIGQVRVYYYKHNNYTSILNGIDLRITCPTRNPRVSGLWVCAPWNFTFTSGVPCVLDKSDKLAVDNILMQRFQFGLGSVRCIDSMWPNSGLGLGEFEPEDVNYLSDLIPSQRKFDNHPSFTLARPFTSGSPYFYNQDFGDIYQATLGSTINDLGTVDSVGRLVSTLNIPDAATAPVIEGLLLQKDSEFMGVLSVSGTQVLVRRGSRFSTPATHASGTINVLYRYPVTPTIFGPGHVTMELVSPSAHRLKSGPLYNTSAGTWPVFTEIQSGSRIFQWNSQSLTVGFVTSASSIVVWAGYQAATSPPSTLSGTVNIAEGCYFYGGAPNIGYPVEVLGRLGATMSGSVHLAIPLGLNDDAVIALSRRLRDVYPGGSGKYVYVEYGDEPWNFAVPWIYGFAASRGYSVVRGITSTTQAWVADKTDHIRALVETVFNEGGRNRSGEIRSIQNQQLNGDNTIMTYIGNSGYKLGALAVAVYTDVKNTTAMLNIYRGASIPEKCDIFMNDLWYNTANTRVSIASAASTLANYNSTFGKNAVLYGYEGGDERIVPNLAPFTVSGTGVFAGAKQISVTSATNIGTGDSLRLSLSKNEKYDDAASEWIVVTGIAGNVLSVARGQFGTFDQDHYGGGGAGSVALMDDHVETSRDMHYHPNWRIIQGDFYRMLQDANFAHYNNYAYTFPWAGSNMWQLYANAFQLPGSGLNNYLCLARWGYPNSKPSGVIQDVQNESVRGQALNDWMFQAIAASSGDSGGGGSGNPPNPSGNPSPSGGTIGFTGTVVISINRGYMIRQGPGNIKIIIRGS